MFDMLSWMLGFGVGLSITALVLMIFVINPASGEMIYNYTTKIGNTTATIYYDEPIEEIKKKWEEMEEEDEEIHKKWAKKNYD